MIDKATTSSSALSRAHLKTYSSSVSEKFSLRSNDTDFRGFKIASKLHKILKILGELYPHARMALSYSNNWELLVSVILSAQCTDKKVNEVTEKLFKKYLILEDYEKATPGEFELDIKSTGFYHTKAKNILAAAKLIKNKFDGKIPKTMDEMLTITGVARKTANVVLGNAYGVVEGIAVDTHVLRLSQRLRLVDTSMIGGKVQVMAKGKSGEVLDYIKDADPVKIERELMHVVAKNHWFRFTYEVIDHGRAVCRAVNPRCNECSLRFLCPSTRT